MPVDATVESLERSGTPVWIDVSNATPEELERLLDRCDIDPRQREIVLDDRRSNRVSIVGGVLLAEFPVVVDVDLDPHPYVSFVSRADLLLTLPRHCDLDWTDAIDRVGSLATRSSVDLAKVAAHVVDEVVLQSVTLMERLRRETETLTTRVHLDPLAVGTRAIEALMRRVLHASFQLNDQQFMLDTIVAALGGEGPFAAIAADLRQIERHVSHVLRLSERLVDQLRASHAAAVAARDAIDSSRLRVLTVVSAIFLPLNLVAGIYGMNFVHDDTHPWNMPELDWRYGYFFALGVMASVALVLVAIFWKRGWLHGALHEPPEPQEPPADE